MSGKKEKYDLIIVGGGPGGLTAGIYAMRAAIKTVLIEKGAPGGQVNNSDGVENWPGTENITGAELAAKFTAHAKGYGLEILNREVTAVLPGLECHTVKLDNNEALETCAVILATGGNPRKLNIPGEDEFYGKGVSYCAVCDGFFFKNKKVIVIGGGDSALEEALYLAKLASEVTLIHRRDAFRAGMILQQRVAKEKKITVRWNTVAEAVLGDSSGVTGVTIRNVEDNNQSNLQTDGIFIFIGFEPNNALVPAGTNMNRDGYVETDAKCETNNAGIFVIGDLRSKYAKQIVTAAGDGCTAALAAAHYIESKKSD